MAPGKFLRSVAWLFVGIIAIVSLTPIELRPVTAAPVSLERFAAFVAVGAALCLGYPKHHLRVLALLIGIVWVLEVAQNYVPGRHGRLPDGLVKGLGALLGAGFAMLVLRRKRVP